jgi:hypothetical protein
MKKKSKALPEKSQFAKKKIAARQIANRDLTKP